MEIYFLRHGIAEDRAADGTDGARRLTAEGVAKLEASEPGLRRLRVRPELLLTSPLTRARETAEVVGRLLGLAPEVAGELAPGCDATRLLRLLEARPRVERVMVVGHEPDFSQMIGALTGGRVEMKKGALACVELLAPASSRGTLAWLVPPRGLR
ncbi:MAG TPA: phosphohistidine phosphatase SixA [Roseiflexaceae bacterium]|nr:phosphohistidine phosphatase SixA [Roseiflexaceae bacterium]